MQMGPRFMTLDPCGSFRGGKGGRWKGAYSGSRTGLMQTLQLSIGRVGKFSPKSRGDKSEGRTQESSWSGRITVHLIRVCASRAFSQANAIRKVKGEGGRTCHAVISKCKTKVLRLVL